MMCLQKMYVSDVMSAGEWLWLPSLPPQSPPHQAVFLQPEFSVSLFHVVLRFSRFGQDLCAPSLYFFRSGFPCCFLLLHFGFALTSFFSWRGWRCERSGVGCRRRESAVTFLPASCLPQSRAHHHLLPHPTPPAARGSWWAAGPGREAAWAAPAPKLGLPRAK